MGYYTRFTLKYELPELEKIEQYKEFEKECQDKDVTIPIKVRAALDEKLMLEMELEEALLSKDLCDYSPLMDIVNCAGDDWKWYDYEKDMIKLSSMFPTILFTLKGEGEEAGDLWIAYFRGGKMQRVNAEIVFAPFDEAKLK